MKRIVLSCVVLLFATIGVAWAAGEAYKLVMSKDKELCSSMLKLFNEDMNKHGNIEYDKHEVFTRVPWTVHVDDGCSILRQAVFDIDNDGKDDLVIKYSGCLRGQLSDGLYIFPVGSDVLTKLKPGKGGGEPLDSTVNKFARTGRGYDLKDLDPAKNEGLPAAIAGVFILQPFIWSKTTYVSMTSLRQEWIVIAKYLKGEEFKDICYFHGKSS